MSGIQRSSKRGFHAVGVAQMCQECEQDRLAGFKFNYEGMPFSIFICDECLDVARRDPNKGRTA